MITLNAIDIASHKDASNESLSFLSSTIIQLFNRTILLEAEQIIWRNMTLDATYIGPYDEIFIHKEDLEVGSRLRCRSLPKKDAQTC